MHVIPLAQTSLFVDVHCVFIDCNVNNIRFFSHFQPKSAEQREKVRKASTEGIAIQGQQGSRLLPEELLKEAFILSDLFDIGELAALELLLAGKVALGKRETACKKMCKISYVVIFVFV